MPFEIDLGKETTCKYCTASKPKFAAARSACVYDGNTRKIAVRFKFRDGTYLAPHIASFMLNAGRELLYKTDVITAVPLHYNRQLKRKYNQASLLAKHLAKQTKIAYEPFLLKRIKSTKQQTKLNKKQRTENVEDAFQASDDFNYRGKTIMIVDDVMTTGATINECAKALKQKGAKKVYALTFARVNSVGG